MSNYYTNKSRDDILLYKFLNMTIDDAKPIAEKALDEIPPALMTISQRDKTYDLLPLSTLGYLCSAKKATLDTRIKAKAVMMFKLEKGTLSDLLLTNEEYLQSRQIEDKKAVALNHNNLSHDEDTTIKKRSNTTQTYNF